MTAAAVRIVVLGVLATSLLACGPDEPPRGPPELPPQHFHFVLEGPIPWNQTLYYATGDAIGDATVPYEGAIVDAASRSFVLLGAPGDPFHVRSERQPTPPEARLFWMVDQRGMLGSPRTGTRDDPLPLEAPDRAVVQLVAPGAAGPDTLTVYDETTHAAASAIRDENAGLDIAAWAAAGPTAGTGNAYRMVAPGRPWLMPEFAPGARVIGGRTAGRLWTAVRADLAAGGQVQIDAGAQPPESEGGTVICENPDAVLLLGGDLPIPAARQTTALAFRARWVGVPAGAHRVRYPDGSVVDVDVPQGGEIRLDVEPPKR